jgi:mxaD protein
MMKKTALAALLALPILALAAPPKTLSVTETVSIKATPDQVWAVVKDFDSLDKWHPAFAKDVLIKGSNNTQGTVRELTIKDGPSFQEELLKFSEKAHSYTYRIIDSPLPISDYKSTLTVKAGKDGATVVTWVGHFKRKNPADAPPEAESDAGAVKLITGVYQGGLSNLKKKIEG